MTETPQITDSHCHLDFPDFDGQVPQIVENAAAAGVTRMSPGAFPTAKSVPEREQGLLRDPPAPSSMHAEGVRCAAGSRSSRC